MDSRPAWPTRSAYGSGDANPPARPPAARHDALAIRSTGVQARNLPNRPRRSESHRSCRPLPLSVGRSCARRRGLEICGAANKKTRRPKAARSDGAIRLESVVEVVPHFQIDRTTQGAVVTLVEVRPVAVGGVTRRLLVGDVVHHQRDRCLRRDLVVHAAIEGDPRTDVLLRADRVPGTAVADAEHRGAPPVCSSYCDYLQVSHKIKIIYSTTFAVRH